MCKKEVVTKFTFKKSIINSHVFSCLISGYCLTGSTTSYSYWNVLCLVNVQCKYMWYGASKIKRSWYIFKKVQIN